jgi:ADP-heptose:LPS heptosyltransferase
MNRNYLEFMHELAEVPFEPKAIFYPTDLEVKWAEKEKKKMGNTVVLWTLAGSSVHKTWPWMDNIIAAIMLETDWHVVLVGDEMCQILEAGWEKEPRVHRRSGKWNIRQTLSFLGVCDLIVGPETGVMNAAGMLNTPKIVTLSHSTDENLTKHWINTTALVPDNTRCYPCHMLHYSFEHCVKDHDENCEDCKNDKCAVHTGAAKCQSNISADHMWSAIVEIMDGKQRKVV